jgi:hypothetical protein
MTCPVNDLPRPFLVNKIAPKAVESEHLSSLDSNVETKIGENFNATALPFTPAFRGTASGTPAQSTEPRQASQTNQPTQIQQTGAQLSYSRPIARSQAYNKQNVNPAIVNYKGSSNKKLVANGSNERQERASELFSISGIKANALKQHKYYAQNSNWEKPFCTAYLLGITI